MTGPKDDDTLPPDDPRYRRDIAIVFALFFMLIIAVLAAMVHTLFYRG